MTPETCPNCGAEVPARARACPECGADEQTGWSEKARTDALGLPDDSFDYDDYARREFGGEMKANAVNRKRVWKIVAAVLVAGFFWFLFRTWFGR